MLSIRVDRERSDPYASVPHRENGNGSSKAVIRRRGPARGGGTSSVKLALAGAAVTALLGGVTSALVLLDVRTLDQYRFWAVGSLAGRDGALAGQLSPFVRGRCGLGSG
jgi:ABC-type Fe3+-siderophore transport system permease subunit